MKSVPVKVIFIAPAVVADEFVSLGLKSAAIYWKLQLSPGQVLVTISFVEMATL